MVCNKCLKICLELSFASNFWGLQLACDVDTLKQTKTNMAFPTGLNYCCTYTFMSILFYFTRLFSFSHCACSPLTSLLSLPLMSWKTCSGPLSFLKPGCWTVFSIKVTSREQKAKTRWWKDSPIYRCVCGNAVRRGGLKQKRKKKTSLVPFLDSLPFFPL